MWLYKYLRLAFQFSLSNEIFGEQRHSFLFYAILSKTIEIAKVFPHTNIIKETFRQKQLVYSAGIYVHIHRFGKVLLALSCLVVDGEGAGLFVLCEHCWNFEEFYVTSKPCFMHELMKYSYTIFSRQVFQKGEHRRSVML